MIFNSVDFELFIRRFSISETLLMNSYDLLTAVANAPINPLELLHTCISLKFVKHLLQLQIYRYFITTHLWFYLRYVHANSQNSKELHYGSSEYLFLSLKYCFCKVVLNAVPELTKMKMYSVVHGSSVVEPPSPYKFNK